MEELLKFNEPSLNVLIITFDVPTAAECKTLMPQYPVHWLTGVDENTSASQVAETVKRTGADGVGMEANRQIIDTAFIEKLKKGGCNEFSCLDGRRR